MKGHWCCSANTACRQKCQHSRDLVLAALHVQYVHFSSTTGADVVKCPFSCRHSLLLDGRAHHIVTCRRPRAAARIKSREQPTSHHFRGLTFQVAMPITWPCGEIAGVTTGSKVMGSIKWGNGLLASTSLPAAPQR